jgi:tetratricopeptide (TPR) repeat protein
MQLTNLGNVLMAEGDYDAALERFNRARHLIREALGDAHPLVAVASIGVGNVYSELDRPADARAEFAKARDLLVAAVGDEHPFVGITHLNLAQTLSAESRFEEALQTARHAAAVIEAAVGSGHPDYAAALRTIADAHVGLMQWDEAEAALQEALSLQRVVFGSDDDRVAGTEYAIASLVRQRGDAADAIEPLRVAVGRLEATSADVRTIGGAYFEIAQAMWDAGEEPAAARAEARRAIELLRDAGPRAVHDGEEIEAWLTEHPLPDDGAASGKRR